MVPGMTMTLTDFSPRLGTDTDTVIVPFNPAFHLDGAVQSLLNVRDATGTYPPVRDAPRDAAAFSSWLTGDPVLKRWVALTADGTVAGHISISVLHPYLGVHLPAMGCVPVAARGFCEISKFFTDPGFQGRGVGRQLFEAATAYAWEAGYQPSLAVVDTSLDARRFYTARGLREAGTFTGVHGINHVFVDETVPQFTAW